MKKDKPYLIGAAIGAILLIIAFSQSFVGKRAEALDAIKAIDSMRADAVAATTASDANGVSPTDATDALKRSEAAALGAIPRVVDLARAVPASAAQAMTAIRDRDLPDGAFKSSADVATAFNRFNALTLSYSNAILFPGVKDIARYDALLIDTLCGEPADWLRLRMTASLILFETLAASASGFTPTRPESMNRKPIVLSYIAYDMAAFHQPPAPATKEPEQMEVETGGRRRQFQSDFNDADPECSEQVTGRDVLVELPMRVELLIEPDIAFRFYAELLKNPPRDSGQPRIVARDVEMAISGENILRMTLSISVFGGLSASDFAKINADLKGLTQ
ncbi:MAG: hypothetical protein ABIH86_07555 [Planctomycetota bacterium]